METISSTNIQPARLKLYYLFWCIACFLPGAWAYELQDHSFCYASIQSLPIGMIWQLCININTLSQGQLKGTPKGTPLLPIIHLCNVSPKPETRISIFQQITFDREMFAYYDSWELLFQEHLDILFSAIMMINKDDNELCYRKSGFIKIYSSLPALINHKVRYIRVVPCLCTFQQLSSPPPPTIMSIFSVFILYRHGTATPWPHIKYVGITLM